MTFLDLLQQIDLSVLFFINQQLANPLFDIVFKALHYTSYFLLASLIIYFVFRKEKLLVVLMILAVIASTITSAALKNIISRERPYQTLDVRQLVNEDDNKSFPSNHVQLSFALTAIIFLFHKKFGLMLFFLSIIMAISRIYLGVHYPSDVLGGAVIGTLIGISILMIRRQIKIQ